MKPTSDWRPCLQEWDAFVKQRPELGYKQGHWALHNFLRHFRQALVEHDAIRFAKRRFWIAHRTRFAEVAFDCATAVIGPFANATRDVDASHAAALARAKTRTSSAAMRSGRAVDFG